MRIPARRTWIDITVVLVLSVFGVVGFEPPFGGYGFLLAGLGGLALGAAVGILASMYRLNAIATTLSAVLIYFLLGSAIAVPGQAIGFVLPSLASLGSLAIGAVYGWADIVTLQTAPPSTSRWCPTSRPSSLRSSRPPFRPGGCPADPASRGDTE